MSEDLVPQHDGESPPVPDKQAAKRSTIQITRSQFSGPMPPPSFLRDYEAACPGSSEVILHAFQDEGAHRRELESKIVNAQIDRDKRQFAEARCAQICALIITLSTIG